MIQAVTASSSTTAAPAGAAVVWHFDPWRERPAVAALAALCSFGLCALVLGARLPLVMVAALSVVCLVTLSPALTPVSCRLDDEGASRRGLFGWERRPWSAIRRIDVVPAGVLLSPFASRHLLDSARALVLPMPRARAAELRAEVERLRASHAD